jgi:hypothetical protein
MIMLSYSPGAALELPAEITSNGMHLVVAALLVVLPGQGNNATTTGIGDGEVSLFVVRALGRGGCSVAMHTGRPGQG